jgi:hypothetical protein
MHLGARECSSGVEHLPSTGKEGRKEGGRKEGERGGGREGGREEGAASRI